MDYPKSVPNVGLVDGQFADENPATGQVGSLIPSAWGNAVTQELLSVIKAAGFVPAEGQTNQLLKAIQGLVSQGIKNSVRVATTGAIALSGVQTIDAIVLVAGDRVLVKNQASGAQNGIYVVATGAWVRALDADESVEVKPGMLVGVDAGTVNGGSVWRLSNAEPPTLGTTALTFEQVFGKTGVVAGSYKSVKVGADGRVTEGTNPTTLAGFGITDAFTKAESNAAMQAAIDALVGSAPDALNAINELAAALGNDPNFETTMLNLLAGKADKANTFNKAEVEDLIAEASALPVGAVLAFTKAAVPPGFLELDGSVQSSAVYPDLAAYLGTTFNQGDEPAGYFRLPDSRGEFLRGWDHGRGVDAGRTLGSLQLDAAQKITGKLGRVVSTASETDTSGPFTPGDVLNGITSGSVALRYLNFDNSLVARTAAETRPRNLAVMWCIKAWNAPVNQGNIDVAALAPLAAKATEISLGVSKIGSQAQVDAGEVDDVIVTPKKLRWGFNAIWGVNGGIAFPSWLGGWIVNWGLQASALSGTISYPIAYTTRAYGIQGQYTHATPSNVNYNITFKDLALSGLSSIPFVSGIANQFQWWGFGK